MDNVNIKMYDSNTVNEYKALLNSGQIPSEFDYLYKQRLENNKVVFILFIEKEETFLFIKKTKTYVIGYCIVEDATSKPESCKPYLDRLFEIPLEILAEYPTVISDCMISSAYRRMGYGKYLADYVVNNIFKYKKISLHAVEDGVNFWDKIGFEYIPNANSVMVIKDGERNA